MICDVIFNFHCDDLLFFKEERAVFRGSHVVSATVGAFNSVFTVKTFMAFLGTPETDQSIPALALAVAKLLVVETPCRVWDEQVHPDTEWANEDGIRNRWSVKSNQVSVQFNYVTVFLGSEALNIDYSLRFQFGAYFLLTEISKVLISVPDHPLTGVQGIMWRSCYRNISNFS